MESVEVEFHDELGNLTATLKLFSNPATASELTFIDSAKAAALAQERVQLIEGGDYEYELLNSSLRLQTLGPSSLLIPSRNPKLSHCGRLKPSSWVGRLRLRVADVDGRVVGVSAVEVRSRKLSYDDEFRQMLEDISRWCVDLAFELASPTELVAIPDPASSAETLYQQFAFVRGLLDSEMFKNAVHRVIAKPHVSYRAEPARRSVHRSFPPRAAFLSSLVRSIRQIPVPPGHPLAQRLSSLASHVEYRSGNLSYDNAENRFVKFTLGAFSRFLREVQLRSAILPADIRIRFVAEIDLILSRLDSYLRADVFRQIGGLNALPLGSTILQRREGYREIHESWLRFGMAARLTWTAVEDAYGAGQRDAATLYEYWVFFQLIELISGICEIAPKKSTRLLEHTADGFGLRLRRGRGVAIDGTIKRSPRDLRVRLDYNRTFGAASPIDKSGSWTRRMRPDYTLSLWPAEISEVEAESAHEMVHIHFDAKYRIEDIDHLFGREDDAYVSDEESAGRQLDEESRGDSSYKREDLLKMHAYRDAIRRSYGAYILYPGSIERQWRIYHEILPGLGAFVLRPGREPSVLAAFIEGLIDHAEDPLTVRARLAEFTATAYVTPVQEGIEEDGPTGT